MNEFFKIAAVLSTTALVLAACERSRSPESPTPDASEAAERAPIHPSAEAAERFLRAIQYSDTRTAAKTHVESTHEGFYCQSEQFRRVFAAAKKRKGPQACEDVAALSNAALEQLDDGARLAAQMLRVTCEQPDATCADYSQRVLEAQRGRWADWTQTMQRFEIQRALGDGDQAVVYVDLYTRPRGTPNHRTLTMNNVDGQWYVADALLEGAAAAENTPTRRQRTESSTEADFN